MDLKEIDFDDDNIQYILRRNNISIFLLSWAFS
jgi:hypothetical protein